MTTFRDREHVVETLVNRTGGDAGSPWEAWRWRLFLEQLDAAGFRVVAKPTLTEHGTATRGGRS